MQSVLELAAFANFYPSSGTEIHVGVQRVPEPAAFANSHLNTDAEWHIGWQSVHKVGPFGTAELDIRAARQMGVTKWEDSGTLLEVAAGQGGVLYGS